jgi:hypothetical protein
VTVVDVEAAKRIVRVGIGPPSGGDARGDASDERVQTLAELLVRSGLRGT